VVPWPQNGEFVKVWYLFTQLDSRQKWLTTYNNC